jgi:hypothetical protein
MNEFPQIPGQLLNPRDLIMIHHSNIALSALFARISDPQQRNPVLSELRPGTLTTLTYQWKNAVQHLNVHQQNNRPERYLP